MTPRPHHLNFRRGSTVVSNLVTRITFATGDTIYGKRGPWPGNVRPPHKPLWTPPRPGRVGGPVGGPALRDPDTGRRLRDQARERQRAEDERRRREQSERARRMRQQQEETRRREELGRMGRDARKREEEARRRREQARQEAERRRQAERARAAERERARLQRERDLAALRTRKGWFDRVLQTLLPAGPETVGPGRPTLRKMTPRQAYEAAIVEVYDILFGGVNREGPAIGFGRATGTNGVRPRFDGENWDLWVFTTDAAGNPVPEGEQEAFLALKGTDRADGGLDWLPGRTPANAILDIAAAPRLWKFDCAEFVQVVQLYALLQAIGEERFNERIRTEFNGRFWLKPELSTGLRIENGWQRTATGKLRHFDRAHPDGRPARGNIETVLNESRPGTEVVFTNPKGDGPWRNEHTIKLGPDLYLAHGVSRQPVSRQDILDKMLKGYEQRFNRKVSGRERETMLQQMHVSAVIRYDLK